MVIEPLFGPGQFKRNSASMSFREQGVTISIAQFLLDTAQEPLIAPTLTGILHDTAVKLQAIIARIGKLVCVQKAEKVRKLTGIATMRRSGKQQNCQRLRKFGSSNFLVSRWENALVFLFSCPST